MDGSTLTALLFLGGFVLLLFFLNRSRGSQVGSCCGGHGDDHGHCRSHGGHAARERGHHHQGRG